MENQDKPLSALEKARLAKQKIENEKKLAEENARQEELQKAKSVTADIEGLKKKKEDLERQKQESENIAEESKGKKLKAFRGVKDALKEMKSSPETEELLKDKEARKEIFGDDLAVRKEARTAEEGARAKVSELENEIAETMRQIEELTKLTPEGKEAETVKIKEELQKNIEAAYNKRDGMQDKVKNIQEALERHKKSLEGLTIKKTKLEAKYSGNLNENIEYDLNASSSEEVTFSKFKKEAEEHKRDLQDRVSNLYKQNDIEYRKLEQEGYSKGIMDRFSKISKDDYDKKKSQISNEYSQIVKERDRVFSEQLQKESLSKIDLEGFQHTLDSDERKKFLEEPHNLQEYLNYIYQKGQDSYKPSQEDQQLLENWNQNETLRQEQERKMKELDASWKSPDEIKDEFIKSEEVKKLIDSLKEASKQEEYFRGRIKELLRHHPQLDGNYPDIRNWKEQISNYVDQKQTINTKIQTLANEVGLRKTDLEKFLKNIK